MAASAAAMATMTPNYGKTRYFSRSLKLNLHKRKTNACNLTCTRATIKTIAKMMMKKKKKKTTKMWKKKNKKKKHQQYHQLDESG